MKPQNILVFDNGVVKIADLGLAKRRGEINREYVCRGTPMYMSPESLTDNVYESPVDIWALGCTIVEMITGEHAWYVGSCENTWTLMNRIGIGEELPKIPQELSQQGKDFLGKCLVKDPNKRWTAHMLLNHPFIKNPLPQPLPSMDHIPSPSLICFCISLGLNSVGIGVVYTDSFYINVLNFLHFVWNHLLFFLNINHVLIS